MVYVDVGVQECYGLSFNLTLHGRVYNYHKFYNSNCCLLLLLSLFLLCVDGEIR